MFLSTASHTGTSSVAPGFPAHVLDIPNPAHVRGQEPWQAAALWQGVEALGVAMLSLDARGCVMGGTAAARALLDLRDGVGLERGALRATGAREQRQLSELIVRAGGGVETGLSAARLGQPEYIDRGQRRAASAVPPAGGAMLLSRRRPRCPLQLVIRPFCGQGWARSGSPAALVFLTDPESMPSSRSPVLSLLYGLTPTEGRLADLLAQGCEMVAAAERMRITVGTARFHLKTVFRKTGTRRQSELVRLVLGVPGLDEGSRGGHGVVDIPA